MLTMQMFQDNAEQGGLNLRFLSNFYPCTISHNNLIYPSVEHFYVAMKSTDLDFHVRISNIKSPGKVKRLGRNVELRQDWDIVKLEIMKFGLKEKFNASKLSNLLTSLPSNYHIVEYNKWHDNYWGYCTCDNCKSKSHQNKLGELLTHIRFQKILGI